MEKIQNFVENSLDSSKRFESLGEELLDYQFQYIEKLNEGALKPLHKKSEGYEESFEDYIYEYTNIRPYLTERYCKLMGEGMYKKEEERKKFNNWYDAIIKEINQNRELDGVNYRNNISKIFKINLEKLIPISEKDNLYRKDEKEERAGLIHFNTVDAMNEFKDFGIEEGDECISIHFKELINQKNNDDKVSNIFSGESLSKLAVRIVDEYPQIKAVIAQSWLVGSPIGKRVGFIVTKKIEDVVPDDRFWGQFINEKGGINKERMQKFLSTGTPEFYLSDGFIKTEDFLKKYLLKERKGIIKLKEITESSKNFKKDVEIISTELNEKWNSSSFEEIVEIVNQNSVLAEYLKTPDGQAYLSIIKKLKELNLDRWSLDKIDIGNKIEIKDKFDKFIKEKSNKYIDKEVMIE